LNRKRFQSDDVQNSSASSPHWLETLAERLSGGGLFALKGVSSRRLISELVERDQLLRDYSVFILDPTGEFGVPTVKELLDRFVDAVQQHPRFSLSRKVRDLYKFISQSAPRELEDGSRGIEALTQLWRSLAAEYPSQVIVRHFDRIESRRMRQIIRRVSRTTYSSFVDAMLEGLDEHSTPVSGLSFATSEGIPELGDVPISSIDLTESIRGEFRDYLDQPRIVEKLQSATGGDVEKLEQYIDEVSAGVSDLLFAKYRTKSEPEKSLLQYLSLSGPLELNVLRESVSEVRSDAWNTLLEGLAEDGLLEQTFDDGALKVSLPDIQLSESIREHISSDSQQRLSRNLALAELDVHSHDTSTEFVARQFRLAGDTERAAEYGRQVADRAFRRRDFETAKDWYEWLLEKDSHVEKQQIRERLKEIARATGEHRLGLEHCQALLDSVDGPQQRFRALKLEEGEIYLNLDDYQQAIGSFNVIEENDEASKLQHLRAKRGIAEAAFWQGEHDRAEQLGKDTLAGLEKLGLLDSPSFERVELDVRNILGKCALVSGRLPEADKCFSRNFRRARDWGWSNKRARAEANLGVLALRRDDYETALERLDSALQIAESPSALDESYFSLNKGTVYQRQAKWSAAIDAYRSAAEMAEARGQESILQLSLYNLATLFRTIGLFERGHQVLDKLENRIDGADDSMSFVGTIPATTRAGLYLDERRFESALQALSDANGERSGSGISDSIYRDKEFLASIEALVELGQTDAAKQRYEKFAVFDEGEAQPQHIGLSIYAKSLLASRHPTFDESVSDNELKRAIELTANGGSFRASLRIGLHLAERLEERGQKEAARDIVRSRFGAVQDKMEQLPQHLETAFLDVPVHKRLRDWLDVGENTADELSSTPDLSSDGLSASREFDRAQFDAIVGECEQLHDVFFTIDRIADSDTPVVIQGESGTGKELVAEAIHEQSSRTSGPMVKVNCGAFVDNLLKSELFGHVKGAFTGAVSDKIGRFEQAEGGTILLDEIGEISEQMQVALLRVLQDQTFQRVGESKTREVDVRIVCATNRDLEQLVEDGDFRHDLYYRLKGVVLELPALRDRREDIPRLVRHFINMHRSVEQSGEMVTRDAMAYLAAYSWPGNIRELENLIESLLLFASDGCIDMGTFEAVQGFFSEGDFLPEPPDIDLSVEPLTPRQTEQGIEAQSSAENLQAAETREDLIDEVICTDRSLGDIQDEIKNRSIQKALTRTEGNITQAAKLLDMNRSRLSQIINGDEKLKALKEKLVG
jgi:transcriptional regulator with GAF, ATPase, and Fis domain/tetratricopeptide (TPR) repeat protein